MFQFPTVWVDNTPDSLLDIALRYCINHQNVFCKYNKTTEEYDDLRDEILLPFGICERLLYLSKTEMPEDRFKQFTTLFRDPARTHLRNLDLSDSVVDDHNLEILTRRNISELNISNCKKLTRNCLPYITKHSNSLVSLNVGDSIQIFSSEGDNNSLVGKAEDAVMIQSLDPHNKINQPSNYEDVFSELYFPFLRKLVIKGLKTKHYLGRILKSTEYLTYLDLSRCDLEWDALECLSEQKQLTSLILCDVMGFSEYVPAICKLKSLRHLDISHTSQISVMWHRNPNEALTCIVESLENLESLDISGTNLAGGSTTKRKSPEPDDTKEGENFSDIPGLESRVNRPLEFLGLLNTADNACLRRHIPAKMIAGHATEEQILIAGQAYCAREQIIHKILGRLVWKLRSSTCQNTRLALDVIMQAMRLHPKNQNIQATGSVSLYSIVKENMKLFNPKMKKKKQERLIGIQAQILHTLRMNRQPNISASVFSEDEQRKIAMLFEKMHNSNNGNMIMDSQGLTNPFLAKLQSFYPSCSLPNNTDKVLWESSEAFRLYYEPPFGKHSIESDITIMLSKLRLYKITGNADPNFVGWNPNQETLPRYNQLETLINSRAANGINVSIYQYLKPVRINKREKKRLIDSRTIANDYQGWVEFNVINALNFWLHHTNKNFGFSVEVEDAYGNVLNPNLYFQNMNCSGEIRQDPPFPNIMELHPEMGENESSLFDNETFPTLDLQTAEFPSEFTEFDVLSEHLGDRIIRKRSNKHDSENSCNAEEAFVTFAEMGLDNYILWPQGVLWTFCEGSCNSGSNEQDRSFYSTLIEKLFRIKTNEVESNCIATTRESLSVILYDGESSIFETVLEDIVPTSCGCRRT